MELENKRSGKLHGSKGDGVPENKTHVTSNMRDYPTSCILVYHLYVDVLEQAYVAVILLIRTIDRPPVKLVSLVP